jgi:outer membrane receptor for ferrienterochelin and colicins
MKFLQIFILANLIVLNAATAQEDAGKIVGNVADAQGNIVGASVTLKGTKIGQITNKDGSFSLKAPVGKYDFQVQYIGYQLFQKSIEVRAGDVVSLGKVLLIEKPNNLDAVVVTGQFGPQSVRNSVYQVRTITNEQIRLRGATNIQSVLSTELGMRFSNDLTLGTTDVQLMGMSGQM